MTLQINYRTTTEEIPIDENKTQKIELLEIEVCTDHPNKPIEIILDTNLFGTNTDNEGIARCAVSEIKDYHVTVNINNETFEENIRINK